MKIERASHHISTAEKVHAEPKKSAKREEKLKVEAAPAEAEAVVLETPVTTGETAPAAQPEEASEKKRGVIRHLEEGHYKGVAALRLRINFFEELDHSKLPEVTAPEGNGKAYAKFLAKYNAMVEAANKPAEEPAVEETPVTEVPAAEEPAATDPATTDPITTTPEATTPDAITPVTTGPVIPVPDTATDPAESALPPVETAVEPLLQLTDPSANTMLVDLIA